MPENSVSSVSNEYAPIVLFVYNRPWHTQQTLEALAKNNLADYSTLYIYADGPKDNATQEDTKKINETRRVIKSNQWCRDVIIYEKEKNIGLAESIVSGVTEIVNKHAKIIVLEDDIVTSNGFLQYMNDALKFYANDEDVMEVSGFMFPIKSVGLADTFFYNVNSCWGWGTWSRAWKKYNSNAMELYETIEKKKSNWDLFNGFQGSSFRDQLISNIDNTLNTWAVKWHATMFLNKGKVLHPSKSLTRNIGFDGTGTNCGDDDNSFTYELVNSIKVEQIENENNRAMDELKTYFKKREDINKTPRASQSKILRQFKKVFVKLKSAKISFEPTPSQKDRLIPDKETQILKSFPRFVDYETNLFGRKIFIVDATTYLSSLSEIFENEIYKFRPKNNKSIFIIDCGANIGLATIYFKLNFPQAHIIAYEADPKICSALEKNIASFNFDNVEVVNAAVSDKNGAIHFKMEGGHSGMITDNANDNAAVAVKAIRLKNTLRLYEDITFLKIDIEGHEIDVLPDIAEELKKVQFLFLEYHSFLGEKQQLDNLLNIIKQAGFRYYLKEAYDTAFPFINREIFLNMDFLVNIFCYRD